MGERGALIVLSVVAATLAAIVALDTGRGGAAWQSRRIVPEYQRADVARVTLARPGEAPVVLARAEPDGPLALTEPVAAPADAAAVDDLLGTVELLSYRRRADGVEVGAPQLSLTLELSGYAPVVLELAAPAGEVDRVWLTRRGDRGAYLVEGYAARALDRRADDLRERRPLRLHPDRVTGVELRAGDDSAVLGGRPLAVHRAGPGAVRADAARVAALLDALDGLVFARLLDRAPDAEPALLRVRIIDDGGVRELGERGPCPGAPALRAVATSAGAGCVEADALAEVAAAIDREALYDRHLVARGAGPVTGIAAGHVALRARGAGWVLDGASPAAAETAAVERWLGALDGLVAGGPVDVERVEVGAAVAEIELAYADGAVDRLVFHRGRRGLLVRRNDEPVYWEAAEAAAALLAADARRFRARALLAEDPFALRALSAREGDRVVAALRRGELLEDWSAEVPAGAQVARGTLERLRSAVATLRADGFVDGELGRPRRVVEAVFDPPPLSDGEARRRRIAITADCRAVLDDDPAVFRIDEGRCRLFLGRWTE